MDIPDIVVFPRSKVLFFASKVWRRAVGQPQVFKAVELLSALVHGKGDNVFRTKGAE